MLLSKSQYVRGLQCEKSLWLYKYRRNLMDEVTAQRQSLFDTGHRVGEYAKQLFPNGVEIEFNSRDFDGMARMTADLIEQGADTLYEATFKENGIFAMADILHRTEKGWNIYEVKASTSTKPYHLDDAAVQYYALNNVLQIDRVFIVHINNKYTRNGNLDVEVLFTVEDVTTDVLDRQADIPGYLDHFASMLKAGMPDIDIGPQCLDPYECDFRGHCWSHVPDRSVFNLYRMGWKERFDLYNSGILAYGDIPDDHALTHIQRLQVDSSVSNEAIVNKEVIRDFLDTLEYPISFLDFETFTEAVPRFDNQRPYMQMAFQYSLHVLDAMGELSHAEYLGDELIDPRREVSERLLEALPESGSIMAYNQSFEISRIRELAGLFPDLAGELLALVDRFVDLMVPFRNLGYYHPDFNGSFSIKAVLPALFPDAPELDYKKLEIQDGGMAMDTFANLHKIEDSGRREQIRNSLTAYCRLDTLAMVRILDKLRELASSG